MYSTKAVVVLPLAFLGVETVVLTVYCTMYGTVYRVLSVLLEGGVLTMHGTMAVTVHDAVGGTVLLRDAVHGTVKGTTVTSSSPLWNRDCGRVHRLSGLDLASRWGAGLGLPSR